MWSEALSVIDRAERLQRQFFTQAMDAWEPPVDVVESGSELEVHIALPGVAADSIAIGVERDAVTVSALRAFPGRGEGVRIHRVEIPYGRFVRRIGIAMDEFELGGRRLADGVLALTFRRKDTQ